jgi:hypothetical protein
MLTIFSIPKAFTGHIATIQLNALQSWTELKPACEIVLCGSEAGVKEAATEFKVRHIPGIRHNEYGTPFINSAFEEVTKIAKHPLLCYVNADIILLDDLISTVRKLRLREYLMIGQRHNIDLKQRLNFDETGWDLQLRELAFHEGSVATHYFIDYFVFSPNGSLEKLPSFTVGRPRWDTWFVYHARSLGISVVDASRVVMAVHQNHDYSHIPHKNDQASEESEAWEGPEARRNRQISAESMGSTHQFSILDATHIMTSRFLLPALLCRNIRKRCHSLLELNAKTKPLINTGSKILRSIKCLKKRLLGLPSINSPDEKSN